MEIDLRRLTAPECDRYRHGCNFSASEREVFDFRVQGLMIYQIAAALHMSESSVSQRLRSIRRKMRRFDYLTT